MRHVIPFALLTKLFSLLLLLSLISPAIFAKNMPPFKSSIRSIPAKIQYQMQHQTWHQGCPVPLKELVYIRLSYWGYDHQSHVGVLVVNKAIAVEVVEIFKTLYQHQFPIQKMVPMDVFHHDDKAAMEANNTSAFNCREVTGQAGLYSQHSYGRAIDINPLINPYVKGTFVLPAEGVQFVNRSRHYPGKISHNSLIYREFIKHGWDWGGSWYDVQDYQHFEKRAGGERRNPYGYPTAR